ncbi:hypothetical protein ACFS4T_13090 [Pseudomonas lini]
MDLTKSNFDIMVEKQPGLFFNRSYDCLSGMIHDSKIKFVADRVEHKALHTLARSMPFDFFSGEVLLTDRAYLSLEKFHQTRKEPYCEYAE